MNALDRSIRAAHENAMSDWMEAAIDTGNIQDGEDCLFAAAAGENIGGEFFTSLRERFEEGFGL